MSVHVGRPLPRVDGVLKVTGRASYPIDVSVEGMTHAVLVRGTITKGRIIEIETAAAEAARGVIAVLTHRTAPRLPYDEPPPGRRLSTEPQAGHFLRVLQDDLVRFNGQPVAVVVAERWEQAVHAASLVRPEYEAEAHTTRIEDGLDAAREPADPTFRAAGPRGTPEPAFAEAAVRTDERYSTPAEHHNPMGLITTVAEWHGPDLTLHDTTQFVYGVRTHLAWVFGIDPERIRVVSPFVGGAFGSTLRAWPHVVATAMAARVVGRPVRLVLSRADMYTSNGYRPEIRHRMRVGADREGRLQALLQDTLSSTSRYEEFVDVETLPARVLYACPNVATTHRLVPLDVPTPAHMRAPGEATGSFALESALDELAVAAGIDPLELRLRNHAEADPESGLPWSSSALRECYRIGAERIGWSRRSPRPGELRDGRLLVGLGMAAGSYPTLRGRAEARARLLADGSAVIKTAATDIGTGTYTFVTQIAADELGVPPERVRVELGDTDLPYAPQQGGSRTAASVGSAVLEACRAVMARVAELPDGAGRPWPEVLERSGLGELEATGEFLPDRFGRGFSSHAFGARFVEVRVDPDTGEVRLARLVSAQAAGRILNPATARSQMLGGTVMGIGMALMERSVFDHRYGRIVNQNAAEYLMPVLADMPDIDVVLVDEEDPQVDPIGVKGIGEVGIVGVAAAIANAVFNATGIRIRDLPIIPDTLVGAISPDRAP
jgi:xanthine dehydrogenase YagR molybdenum-binding subunit